jgi:rRNA processing protein Gar1
MVIDRTVVVESVVSNGSAPLDEGSLLVIRVLDEGDMKANARLLPLGKVFEVFGPVSRPLYTIRLPPATKKEVKKEIKVNDCLERDADEISLNDDEDTEQGESREAETTKGATSTKGEQSIATTVATSSNGDEEKKLDRNDGDYSAHDNESDPWSPEGNFTKLLQSTQGMTVYYIPDIARLLDTGAIIRNSGRGCGKLIDTRLSITLIFSWALTILAVTFHRCIKSV